MFEAKVLLDSVNCDGTSRLTTMQLTMPRIILAEFNTHRSRSRNAASSRAIPVEKMIAAVERDPFIPVHWGKNQKGMQADAELSRDEQELCKVNWLEARDESIDRVKELIHIGLHKQIANRLLEPWMWATVITSATDRAWRHFFGLRCHPAAEPHMRTIAEMARECRDKSDPRGLPEGAWHLPLFGFDGDDEIAVGDRQKVSTARCARVSYLTHDGKRDPAADITLHDGLEQNGHWSPFEHCAMSSKSGQPSGLGGNFGSGWIQYRKTRQNEFAA